MFCKFYKNIQEEIKGHNSKEKNNASAKDYITEKMDEFYNVSGSSIVNSVWFDCDKGQAIFEDLNEETFHSDKKECTNTVDSICSLCRSLAYTNKLLYVYKWFWEEKTSKSDKLLTFIVNETQS